jgi:hypothetical protein
VSRLFPRRRETRGRESIAAPGPNPAAGPEERSAAGDGADAVAASATPVLPRPWIAGSLLVAVPLLIVALLTWSPLAAALTDGVTFSRAVSQQQLEAEYGVRVDLVAVTAAGGLVDVRFTVVDKDKAERLFGDSGELPIVAVEGTDVVLRASHGMHHNLTLLKGGTYFLLFANAGGRVQAGTPVSVVIDGVRVEHLTAQV